MKKFLLGALAGVTLALSLNVGAASAFAKVNNYAETTFTDVTETAWYAPEIKNAYELGFMNGTSDTQMSPDGTVTVAQAVTIASRANAVYNGRSAELEASTGTKWYDVYLDYAEKYGIINKADYNSFDRAARRYEVALMFSKALPESHYTSKNNVTTIPDVYAEDEFYDEILMLYKAGVVMGSDDYGTFYPNNSIKRSEIAAIINRAALPENRLTGTLNEYPYDRMDQAVLLIDDLTSFTHNRKDGTGVELNHAWNVDDRGNPSLNSRANYNGSFSDLKDDSLVAVRRYITPVTDQHVVLETRVSLDDAGDGFSIYLSSPDKTPVVGLVSKDGYWGVMGKTNTMSKVAYVDGINDFKLDMDLAGKFATLYVNGVLATTGEIGDFDSLNEINFTTSDEGEMSFGFVTTRLYMNYNVFDSFRWEAIGNAPYGYKTTGNVLVQSKATGDFDPQTVQMNGASSATKSFEAMKNGFVVEAYVLPVTQTANKASVEIKNGAESIVKIDMENGVYSIGGEKVWQYHGDIWQSIRFEKYSDGRVVVRLCGKDVYEFDYNGAVDTIVITNEGNELWFDDVKAYNTYDFVDYVSQPVAVNEMDDYILTMSVCSLWHEGTHSGWDFVAPYDELIPIMGFYDEGLPETSDWEIKYMVEHGIDAFQPCWYAGTSSANDPMKIARNNQYAINDGYFNAKYKDMLDICIMWENQSFTTGLTKEKFQKHLWNYWVDYYFTDPNYLTIDNKAFLTIYRMDVFLKCFSSGEEAMEVLNFMREDIKNYGYDDIIITFNCYSNANTYDKTAKDAGLVFDGFVPYHWGIDAHNPEYIKQQHNKGYTGKGDNFVVPCVSTGRNIIGWEQTRSPIATHEQHVEALEFIKNDYLKRAEADFGADSWQSKLVFFGTWNEYAEGHWIAPTGRNGNGPYFDYSSAWANVFTGVDTSVYDITPTMGQKARIAYMYPAVEVPIRAWLLESNGDEAPAGEEIPMTVVASIDFNSADDQATFSFTRTDSHTFADGKVTVVAESEETKSDSIMRTTKFTGLDTSKVDAIHIRMKGTAESSVTLYPTFDYDAAYTAAKSMGTKYTTPGEWQDIYIDLRNSPFWMGKVATLRLNLFNGPYGTYECDTIELMTYGDKSAEESDIYGIYTDGIKLDISKGYVWDDGNEVYVAALPVQGFYATTNIYHEWHRFEGEGKLYLKAGNGDNAKEIVFTVGSKTALVDGVEKTLAKEFYLYDAIPVLPVRFVFDNLGIKYTYDAEYGIKADIRGIDFSEILENRKSHSYGFDMAGDNEGWEFGKSSGFILDGAIVVVPIEQNGGKWDSMLNCKKLTPEVLVATNCDTITVRMKYELPEDVDPDSNSLTPQLFFCTSNETSFAATRQVTAVKYADAPVDEEGWSIFTFDMASNENWKGSITQLRFDPSSTGATAIIDYIKCNLKDTGIDEGTIYEEETAVIEYNFDEALDTKVVTMTRATANVENGHLVIEATPREDGKFDPIVNLNQQFDASAVGKIAVRLKLEGVQEGEKVQLFFATPDAAYSADRCITLNYSNQKVDSEGYYTIVFDTSAMKGWGGTVKSLRIDPFGCAGKAYIDYIKLYESKGGTTPSAAPSTPQASTTPATPSASVSEDIAIENGDAEDVANAAAFHSMYGNNKISIVEDPRNSNNHVWKVEPTKDGKTYVSLFQNVTFIAGRTYKIEYDVCVVSNFKGEAVEKTNVFVNSYYNDDKKNHTKTVSTAPSGEWKHVSTEVTIENTTSDRSKDAIGMFASPVNEIGMVVLLDNFTITRVD